MRDALVSRAYVRRQRRTGRIEGTPSTGTSRFQGKQNEKKRKKKTKTLKKIRDHGMVESTNRNRWHKIAIQTDTIINKPHVERLWICDYMSICSGRIGMVVFASFNERAHALQAYRWSRTRTAIQQALRRLYHGECDTCQKVGAHRTNIVPYRSQVCVH